MGLQFSNLVSRFNDTLKFACMAEIYELLKKRGLSKFLTSTEQATVRPYLFDRFHDGPTWPERKLFTTHDLSELEEQRVHSYLDHLLSRFSKMNPAYPKARSSKERQLYALLRELDARAKLYKRSDQSEDSLAFIELSFELLTRLVTARPKASRAIDLLDLTAQDLKAMKFQKKAIDVILAYVEKYRPVVAAEVQPTLETDFGPTQGPKPRVRRPRPKTTYAEQFSLIKS